jgi:hypothetical protein
MGSMHLRGQAIMPGLFLLLILASGSQILTFSSSMNVEKGWRRGEKGFFSINFPFFPLHFYPKFAMMSPILQGFFMVSRVWSSRRPIFYKITM